MKLKDFCKLAKKENHQFKNLKLKYLCKEVLK